MALTYVESVQKKFPCPTGYREIYPGERDYDKLYDRQSLKEVRFIGWRDFSIIIMKSIVGEVIEHPVWFVEKEN